MESESQDDFREVLFSELQKLQRQRSVGLSSSDRNSPCDTPSLDRRAKKIPVILSHWDSVDQTCKLGEEGFTGGSVVIYTGSL